MTAAIQYLLPAKVDDSIDSGGQITANVYPDNTSNVLFPPIADVDVLGSVRLRKLFVSAASSDKTVFGPAFYLLAPPENSAVDVVFVPSSSFADKKPDIIDACLSSISVPGSFYLIGDYQKGDQQLAICSYTDLGNSSYYVVDKDDVLLLNSPGKIKEYIKVASDHPSQTMHNVTLADTDGSPFTRRVWTFNLTAPLTQAFSGQAQILKNTSQQDLITTLNNVYVSIPTSYYGIRPIADAAGQTDSSVTVDLPRVPVNLPVVKLLNNGSVDIFDTGRNVVVHNTVDETFEDSTLTAGQVVQLNRTNLSMIILYDSAGTLIPEDRYSFNLASGTVTMASPLNLSGFTQPLVAKHTIETLAKITALSDSTVSEELLDGWDGHVGETITLDHDNLYSLVIKDQIGRVLNPGGTSAQYIPNLDAGTLVIGNAFFSGYTQPFIAYYIYNNKITITLDRQLGRSYAADTSYISSVYTPDDMYPYYYNLFSQHTWTGVWSSALIGDGTDWQYDDVDYPIEVGSGCIDGDWALRFVTTTRVAVLERHLGNLGEFSILDDIEPVNPITSLKYWSIKKEGWNTGQAVDNVLRFKTGAAAFGVWFLRNISASEPPTSGDSFSWATRANVLP